MRIGEVARLSGVSARMLRHYDRIGLVSPSLRESNGYRDYDDADLERLFQVESLRLLGLSLREIGPLLGDAAYAPAALVERLIAGAEERIERENRLLARLNGVRGGDPNSWSDVLGIVGLLQELGSPDPSRRQQAALGDPAAMPPSSLVDALLVETEPAVVGGLQWALAARVGGAGRTDPVPLLQAALADASPTGRRNIAGALAKIDTPAAEAIVVELLEDKDDRVRSRAALTLGARGRVEAIPALIGLIGLGVEDVSAADALGVVGRASERTDEIVADVARAIDASTLGASRVRLTQALAELPGAGSRHLAERLVDDVDPEVRVVAGYVLRMLPGPPMASEQSVLMSCEPDSSTRL